MRVANVHEAKTNLSKLLDAAEQGEDVVITRRGSRVGRFALVPLPAHDLTHVVGAFKGRIRYARDYDDTADAVVQELFDESTR